MVANPIHGTLAGVVGGRDGRDVAAVLGHLVLQQYLVIWCFSRRAELSMLCVSFRSGADDETDRSREKGLGFYDSRRRSDAGFYSRRMNPTDSQGESSPSVGNQPTIGAVNGLHGHISDIGVL